MVRWRLVLALWLAVTVGAAPAIRLKTRQIEAAPQAGPGAGRLGIPEGRREAMHALVQYAAPPGGGQVKALEGRGIRVLQYVPDNAFLVLLDRDSSLDDLGLVWAGPLAPADKISPDLMAGADTVVVEFHPDVTREEARWILLRNGVEALENPDLSPNHLLARVTSADVGRLSNADEVAYIFPSSSDLTAGRPVRACVSALTGIGRAAQFTPVVGEGWDGPGLGAASLTYVFSKVTDRLPGDSAKSEIARALQTWSKYVKVSFQPGTNPNGKRTVNILFASKAHGDGYAFDGPGGILAHTFYPSPPNPEPIAGDMHFDQDESWRIGADVDLFSVALHEAGHALGLGHSDRPGDVMYPYYSIAADLTANDISAIRQLYAAQNTTIAPPTPNPPPPAATPIQITVTEPVAAILSDKYTFSGTASGGTGTIHVTWTMNGKSGAAKGSGNWTAEVPLALGVNQVSFQATDAKKATATKSVTVTRAQQETKLPTGKTTPSLAITSPTASVVSTTAKSIVLKGTASDAAGLTGVFWSTAAGASGTAIGTSKWETAPIPLLAGVNTIVVQAANVAGTTSWRSIVVTRR